MTPAPTTSPIVSTAPDAVFQGATNGIGQILTIVGMLGIVILLFYLFTRIMAVRYTGMGSGKNIEVIERIGLSKDATLQLARIGERYFVIGVTDHQVNTLAELSEGEVKLPERRVGWNPADILRKKSPPPPSGAGFSTYLNKVQDMMRDNPEDEDDRP